MRFLCGVLALLLVACGGKNKEHEEEIIPTGYVGQARVNPYLAAERFLKADGWNISSERVWGDFGYETSTIILPASFLTSKGVAMRALEWVEEGGLLVVLMKGGESEINDFTRSSWSFSQEVTKKVGLTYFMEELEVMKVEIGFQKKSSGEAYGKLSTDWNVATISYSEGDEYYEYEVEFEDRVALSSDLGSAWEFEKEQGARMLTTDHGDGTVMFLAHARPFRNAYVDRADHPEFLQVVAGWNTYRGDGKIVFLYGSSTSFFDLLWQQAWPAIIAGAILLLVWLWMRIPRFGPVKEDDFTYRRPYGDGLKAAASFIWRKKALEYYLKPLRSSLQGNLNPGEVVAKLARESDLSAEEIQQALYSKTFKEPGAITRMVKHLQLLLKR